MKRLILILAVVLFVQQSNAQTIHSHNDYDRKVPFYEAYAAGADILEVDLFLSNNEIKVCHNREDVANAPTIHEVYFKPIQELLKNGKDVNLTLMIDIKDSRETLMAMFKLIEKEYSEIIGNDKVKILVCGSIPNADEIKLYPTYVTFDTRPSKEYNSEELARVGLFSYNFKDFTKWDGKGAMSPQEEIDMQAAIDKAHALGKPIRFWGAPDNVNTWVTLANMGVDVINTDKIAECCDFFTNYKTKKSYTLKTPQSVYAPKNVVNKSKKVKNVIWLIGDGMSTTQITATETANRGNLSMLNLSHLGFIKTSAKNSYNTDSAGAGTAFATGNKTVNRRIGTDSLGNSMQNISEMLSAKGIRTGVVTTDNVTGATPSAFYGHTAERNNAEEIAAYAHSGALWLLAGAGEKPFVDRKDKRNILNEAKEKGFEVTNNFAEIPNSKPTICLDNNLGKYASEDNLNFLGEATKKAIESLENKDGFFLMVESAKIDNGGHANDIRTTVLETLLFDKAVAEAMKFADSNEETLVIVTADHETGGMVLLSGSRTKGNITVEFTSNDHTGVMIPLFSHGAKASSFSGVMENSDVMHRILKVLNK